jgi:hypothetical protein
MRVQAEIRARSRPLKRCTPRKNHQEWKTWDKGLITIKINLGRESIWATSVHCYPFHEFGRRADESEFAPIWSTLAQAINEIPGTAIIAGDFNTERRYLLTSLLDNADVASSFEGTATHAEKSVDDILHGINLFRRSSKVSVSFSDHAFCQADFFIRTELPMNLSKAANMVTAVFESSPAERSDLQVTAQIVAGFADHGQLLKLINAIRDDPAAVQRCAAMSGRHPLGHDKIALMDAESSWRLRLHAWWPGRVAGVEHVHHHRFNFSTVMIRGSYEMQIFQKAASGIEMIEYRQHSDPAAGEWYLTSAGAARLQLLAVTSVTERASYSLDANTLHRVLVPPDTLCLTLFLANISNVDLSAETRVFALPEESAPTVKNSQKLTADGYRKRLDAIAAELTTSS